MAFTLLTRLDIADPTTVATVYGCFASPFGV